jgi:hypothetical protein
MPKYDSGWDCVDEFDLAEAINLLANVAPGDDSQRLRPYIRLVHTAVCDGELPTKDGGQYLSQYVRITRAALIEFAKAKGIRTPYLFPEHRTQDAPHDASTDLPDYTTPYIRLLYQAIKDNKIDSKHQPKAETLQKWFRVHGTSDVPVSNRMSEVMTTIVRLPEMRQGGAHPRQKPAKG